MKISAWFSGKFGNSGDQDGFHEISNEKKGGTLKWQRDIEARLREPEMRIIKETRPSAKLSYARISVQKACYVLDVIRGKDVQTALGILTYNPRYASSVLKKLLESAIANAENNNGMSADNLYIAECYANKGPTMKRIQPRAQGRAYRIEKRTSISPSCWMKDKEEKHGTES